jgi:signal transduction histidine kinase
MCEGMREVLGSIDEIVWLVNSQRDTLNDFITYICKHAQFFLQSTPIRCRFDVEQTLPALTLNLSIRRNLLLVVKEAINNLAKHSDATEAYLRIRCANENLVVVVEDNGKGFDMTQADVGRNGLSNMAQRMTAMGGCCLIESRPDSGCRLEFSLPVRQIQPRWPWHRLRFQFPWKRQEAMAKSANSNEHGNLIHERQL